MQLPLLHFQYPTIIGSPYWTWAADKSGRMSPARRFPHVRDAHSFAAQRYVIEGRSCARSVAPPDGRRPSAGHPGSRTSRHKQRFLLTTTSDFAAGTVCLKQFGRALCREAINLSAYSGSAKPYRALAAEIATYCRPSTEELIGDAAGSDPR